MYIGPTKEPVKTLFFRIYVASNKEPKKMMIVVLITCLIAAVVASNWTSKKKDKGSEKSIKFNVVDVVQQIAIIMIGALLSLWLTNYSQDAASKSQLRSYYELEKQQNYEIIQNVERIYYYIGTDTSMDAFVNEDAEFDAAMRSILSSKGLDENTINYSDMAVTFSQPKMMSFLYKAVNERNDELQMLKKYYDEDQEISPRVFVELFHVVLNANDAYRAYEYQLRWLDHKPVPDSLHEGWTMEGVYEDGLEEMVAIRDVFFHFFPLPICGDDDYLYHNFFDTAYGRKAEEMTWDIVNEELVKRKDDIEKLMGN